MTRPTELLLEERWPEVLARLVDAEELRDVTLDLVPGTPVPTLRVDGVQLAGAVDPGGEAALQALLVPPDATRATLYGFGQGALPRELLRRPGLARLDVVITSVRAAVVSLLHLDHEDWLGDARVELVLPSEHAEVEVPFAACPSDLALAEGEGARLRDLVRMELATPFVRRALARREEEQRRNVAANEAHLTEDEDVGRIAGAARGGVVRVCAAGPTLSDHYERLREGEGPIVAVDAALQPLLEAGVVPDVVVTLDSLPHGSRAMFDVPAERLANTTLVYFPVVPAETVERWPGKRLLALGNEERYAELAGRRPEAVLWTSGSVIHPAVDLAVRLGASRVELYGADFATPRGRSHVDGMAWQVPVEDEAHRPWVTDGHGERVPSQPNLIGYLRELERYIARTEGVAFVNAGRDGARILGAPHEPHALDSEELEDAA